MPEELMNKKFFLTIGAGILLIAILYFAVPEIIKITGNAGTESPEELDNFAKCLTEKDAKFYGASWCSHCNNQKTAFGSSMQYIQYVECTEEAEQCNNAGITAYPTWIINSQQYLGEQSFEKLSEITGCELQ